MAKFLLDRGKADVSLKTHTGATPLHGASLQGNVGGYILCHLYRQCRWVYFVPSLQGNVGGYILCQSVQIFIACILDHQWLSEHGSCSTNGLK